MNFMNILFALNGIISNQFLDSFSKCSKKLLRIEKNYRFINVIRWNFWSIKWMNVIFGPLFLHWDVIAYMYIKK